MLINWAFWYASGMVFFVVQTLLFRPGLVAALNTKELLFCTFCYPLFYGYLFYLDCRDTARKRISFATAFCTVSLITCVLLAEEVVRRHALQHVAVRSTALLEYEQHIAGPTQEGLPRWHRLQHQAIDFLVGHRIVDLHNDHFGEDR